MKPIDRNVGLILLASGQSSRFDGNKLTTELGGRPLAEWAIDTAEAAGFTRKIMVKRGDCFVPRTYRDWEVVVNNNAHYGLSTSIRAGVSAAKDCERVVIILADMPFVSAGHLLRLANAAAVAFTRYPDGHKGCPAAFPSQDFPALLALDGDRGAASIAFPDEQLFDASDPSSLADVDTRADLQNAATWIASDGATGL